MTTTVGWIGLGAMGGPMATCVARAGYPVTAYDIDPQKAQSLAAEGITPAATVAAAADSADALVLMVATAGQAESVLFGDGAAAAALKPGAVVMLMATVGPAAVEGFAARLEPAGVEIVDAPVSGGAARAGAGDLLIMVSGSERALSVAGPLLDVMARNAPVVGSAPGDGQKVKLVNQLLAGVHIAAACEAIAFAAKQELDIRKVYEVITASAGNSWMFENRIPHVLDGDYTPRSAVEIFVKDLGIIQDMARNQRFPVPVSAAALQMFLMTSAAGMGRADDASVARMYAQVTGTKLPGQSD